MEETGRVRLSPLLLIALLGCADRKDAPALSSATLASGAPGATVASAASEEDGNDLPQAVPGQQPTVSLSGVYTAPPALEPAAPVVGAVAWNVPIHKAPDRDAKLLGMLRGGSLVRASGKTAGASKDCAGGWRSVEPAGWVCKDEVSEDRAHPILEAAFRGPNFAEKLPYMYGTVTRGGPVYARVPMADEVKAAEPGLAKHLSKWRADKESGATYGLDVWLRHEKAKTGDALELLESRVTDVDLPRFLRDGAAAPNLSGLVDKKDAVRVDQVDRRQGRSFVDTFLVDGRRYNLTPDLLVIPADRFRPIRGSDFHGYPVAELGIEPPFALIRREGAKRFVWSASKNRMVAEGPVEFRSLVKLTGKQKFQGGVLHFETSEGFYVDDRHASRVDHAKRWPKWAQEGSKWLDVNLTKQVLVAYEGQKMVYATLVSSGEDGLADPEKSKRATIRGIYRIHTKHVSVTMDSTAVGEEFELRDVPYVQYFNEGYALHGAYWHDRFGTPKSHGCINLSPEDARRIFFWTEPSVPSSWHAAMKPLTGTILFIHP
jgi:hypothetical protein